MIEQNLLAYKLSLCEKLEAAEEEYKIAQSSDRLKTSFVFFAYRILYSVISILTYLAIELGILFNGRFQYQVQPAYLWKIVTPVFAFTSIIAFFAVATWPDRNESPQLITVKKVEASWDLSSPENIAYDPSEIEIDSATGTARLKAHDQSTYFLNPDIDEISPEHSNVITLNSRLTLGDPQSQTGYFNSPIYEIGNQGVNELQIAENRYQVATETPYLQTTDLENLGGLTPGNITSEAGISGASMRFNGTVDSSLTSAPLADFPTQELTVAFWVNTADSDNSFVSYATDNNSNEVLIHRAQSLTIHRGNGQVNTRVNISDGAWHHVAVVWAANSGECQLYVDGVLMYSGYLAQGRPIAQGGVLVVGNEQDSVGGGFDPFESYTGLLDELQIFGKKFDDSAITKLYTSQSTSIGLQLRECELSSCEGSPFAGPDSNEQEFYNPDANGSVKLDKPLNSGYFQYKIILDNKTGKTSPEIEAVKVLPSSYSTSGAAIEFKTAIPYFGLLKLEDIVKSDNYSGITYQVSSDSQVWYYWNGLSWEVAENNTSSNSSEAMSANIPSFSEGSSESKLFLKAFLFSNGTASPELRNVKLSYTVIDESADTSTVAENSDSEVAGVETESEPADESISPEFELYSFEYVNETDTITAKGFASDDLKIVIYNERGEVVTRDSLYGDWDMTIEEASEKFHAGQNIANIIITDENGENRNYQSTAFEIPPRVPVITLSVIAIFVSMFLVFTGYYFIRKPNDVIEEISADKPQADVKADNKAEEEATSDASIMTKLEQKPVSGTEADQKSELDVPAPAAIASVSSEPEITKPQTTNTKEPIKIAPTAQPMTKSANSATMPYYYPNDPIIESVMITRNSTSAYDSDVDSIFDKVTRLGVYAVAGDIQNEKSHSPVVETNVDLKPKSTANHNKTEARSVVAPVSQSAKDQSDFNKKAQSGSSKAPVEKPQLHNINNRINLIPGTENVTDNKKVEKLDSQNGTIAEHENGKPAISKGSHFTPGGRKL